MKLLVVNSELRDLDKCVSNLMPKELIQKSLLVVEELTVYINELKNPLKKLIHSKHTLENGLDTFQKKLHGLAWSATYIEALKQLGIWAYELNQNMRFGEIERILLICPGIEPSKEHELKPNVLPKYILDVKQSDTKDN